MESRSSRHKEMLEEKPIKATRMGKNQYLYDEINNRIGYEELTSLDTQTRIDLNGIARNNTREDYQKTKDYRGFIIDEKKEQQKDTKQISVPEPKIFDINSILEEARKNRTEKDELERKRKLNSEQIESLQKRELESEQKNKTSVDEDELTDLINTITSHSLAKEIEEAEEKGLLDELIATNADMQIQEGIANEAIEETKREKIVNSFYTQSMDLSNQDFELSDEMEAERLAKKKVLVIITTIMLIIGIGVAIYFVLKRQGII